MAVKSAVRPRTTPAVVCGVGTDGLKCAVVSWVAPLLAVVVLIAGLRYPAVNGFNILIVAFGIASLVRSFAHIRAYGSCGLGGHFAIGLMLNLIVVVLVAIYLFTGLDPVGIRP